MICHASSKFERRKVVESSFSFPLKLLHELFVHCQGDTCLIESVGNFFRYHGLHVVDTFRVFLHASQGFFVVGRKPDHVASPLVRCIHHNFLSRNNFVTIIDWKHEGYCFVDEGLF
uniref:Uncharacterized protein n=1 Tax=Cacopsylla melanoneura TaxID=428564 RepID=A0A8D8SZR4_9HEMI